MARFAGNHFIIRCAVVSTALFANIPTASSASAVADAFASACLPQRLSFDKANAHAMKTGWSQVLDSDDPELESVMTRGRKAAHDPENPDWRLISNTLVKETKGKRLYLVLTRMVAPDVITLLGCYIYDFNAKAPTPPQSVSTLLKHKIAYSTLDKTGDAWADPAQIISHVWGPPPSLPRQFDTYLSFIPENSPLVAKTGFSGTVLKSSASEPPQSN